MKRKLILITGGSASGKTFLANELKKILSAKVTLISQDCFYKDGDNKTNYDEPNSIDFNLQAKILESLKSGKKTNIPIYNYDKFTSEGHNEVVANEFIILEGIFAMNDPNLNEEADLKIFIDTPSDTRLARRVVRDVNERGRDISKIINRWIHDVQPSFKNYISKTRNQADIIIPWHKINNKSIKSIISSMKFLDSDINQIMKD